MRVGLVVQRYGLEVGGGAEALARQVAERLLPHMQIEVLTTCASDYMTWENRYPPGYTQVNGVPVRRFAVRNQRNVEEFNRYSLQIINQNAEYYDEVRWMAMQGPDAPDLFRYLDTHQDEYDLFYFFTYLYATSFVGLQRVARKSILQPTAHDEPTLRLGIFQSFFHLPRGFLFNTHEEERLVRERFHNKHIPGAVIGVGIDQPEVPALETMDDEYVLYLGRVDESKGCRELFDYFLSYKAETGDPVKLALVGLPVMPVPDHPDIRVVGFLPDNDHFAWLNNAQLLIMPSPYESLSMVTLEAWMLEVPVLLNGQASVLRGHAHRSHGGIYYSNKDEFIESMKFLRSERETARQMGKQGRRYVLQNYQWDHVTRQYTDFFKEMYERVTGCAAK